MHHVTSLRFRAPFSPTAAMTLFTSCCRTGFWAHEKGKKDQHHSWSSCKEQQRLVIFHGFSATSFPRILWGTGFVLLGVAFGVLEPCKPRPLPQLVLQLDGSCLANGKLLSRVGHLKKGLSESRCKSSRIVWYTWQDLTRWLECQIVWNNSSYHVLKWEFQFSIFLSGSRPVQSGASDNVDLWEPRRVTALAEKRLLLRRLLLVVSPAPIIFDFLMCPAIYIFFLVLTRTQHQSKHKLQMSKSKRFKCGSEKALAKHHLD